MAAVQDSQQDHGPVMSVQDARQGQRGRHIAWVLGLSMLLIVAGFTGLYLYHLPHLSTTGSQSTVTSQQALGGQNFQAPPSQPRQSENKQTTPTITPGVGSDGRGL